MLKYPVRLNENETDFVRFQHSEYRTNSKYSGNGPRPQAPNTTEGIVLYMPNSTPPVAYTNSWSNTGDLLRGPLGQFRVFGAKSLSGAVETIGDVASSEIDMGEIASRAGRAGKELGSFASNNGGEMLKQLVADTAGKALVGSGNNYLALTQGKVYNPNIELLYQGPSLRTFAFEFTFVPRSSAEAEAVSKIIKEFKLWSAPKADGHYLKVPHVWHINYGNTKTAKYMNKFLPCAMTSFETQDNASSDGHYTYIDGVPASTSIRMSFSEVDIITRENHEEGGPRGF